MTTQLKDRSVRLASVDEASRVGEVITEAFEDDALTHWVVPNRQDWDAVLPAYFGGAAEQAVTYGSVYVVDDFAAVAVWFDVSQGLPEPAPEPPAELVEVTGEYAPRFHALEQLMLAAHPPAPPQGPAYHELAFMAVRRSEREHGIGSALLDLHHEALDQQGLGAFLDASNPNSRRLYLRHGYHDLGEPFHPPLDGPPVWPMWRPPAR